MADTAVEAQEFTNKVKPLGATTSDALLFAAFLHLNFGRLAECETILRYALRTEWDDPRFLKLGAHVFIERKHPADALELLERLEQVVDDGEDDEIDPLPGSPLDILFARAHLAIDDIDAARSRFQKHVERSNAAKVT